MPKLYCVQNTVWLSQFKGSEMHSSWVILIQQIYEIGLPLIGKAKMRFGHNNLLSFPTFRFPKHIALASNAFEDIKANCCVQNAFWLYQLVVRNAEFLSYSNLANLQNSGDYCSKPHTCFIASRASSVRATASSLARDAAAASFAISGASSKILLCSTTSEPHKQPTNPSYHYFHWKNE